MTGADRGADREALVDALQQNHQMYEAAEQQALALAETLGKARDLTAQVLRVLGDRTPDRA